MKKLLAMILTVIMIMGCVNGMAADNSSSETNKGLPEISGNDGFSDGKIPPEKPDESNRENMTPPEMPHGEKNDGTESPERPFDPAVQDNPPELPDGGMEFPGGVMMGGMHDAPDEYSAIETVTDEASFTGSMESTGTDENLIHVKNGNASISDATLNRISSESSGGDISSFYGVGAAILTTGGTAVIENSSITTDAAGGTGVFAYGDGVVYVSDTTITTAQNTSGGIHVAGGGTLYAKNLIVTTAGESSAAIRSDRGSGTMVVNEGTYTSNGIGSPAVYVTADITIHDSELVANGSEALCMEGLNTVRLFDCNLSGAMQDLEQNDNTWTVIVYQSMSGDSEIGKGHFEMSGGTLNSGNGGVFYTTNTESEFILKNVDITTAIDSEYFLRVTGNSNQRGWGSAGENGAKCTFTGLNQSMNGDVQWDSISTLDMYISEGSQLNGAIINDESCAGEGGEGYCDLYIDETSFWIVTGDSKLTHLYCEGVITDAEGNSVTIAGKDGTIFLEGESEYTVTVDDYIASCDASNQGNVSEWTDYAVEF